MRQIGRINLSSLEKRSTQKVTKEARGQAKNGESWKCDSESTHALHILCDPGVNMVINLEKIAQLGSQQEKQKLCGWRPEVDKLGVLCSWGVVVGSARRKRYFFFNYLERKKWKKEKKLWVCVQLVIGHWPSRSEILFSFLSLDGLRFVDYLLHRKGRKKIILFAFPVRAPRKMLNFV